MAVVDEFWQDKLNFADAERNHYRQLATNQNQKQQQQQQQQQQKQKHQQQQRKEHKAPAPPAAPAPASAPPPHPRPEPAAPPPPTEGQSATTSTNEYSLANEVAKAREHIKKSLECMDTVLASVPNVTVEKSLHSFESEIQQLKATFSELKVIVLNLQAEMKELKASNNQANVPRIAICPMKPPSAQPPPQACPVKPPQPSKDDDDDDGVDLFGSDSEDEEAVRIREERLAAYAAKKSKKPAVIAKSSILLDCKPWDDETDMKVMEQHVRTIVADGLLWGASKLVPLAYGINKLQISCVIEDDKISVDWLQEEIEKFEDFVQSVDIAAFNKI